MIPVAIVDDGEADRYLVKRRLSRYGEFQVIIEFHSGDLFLEEGFNRTDLIYTRNSPLLVLMDINMPGRNGFQTVEEISARTTGSIRADNTVILMYTSSLHVKDQERAREIEIIKGYMEKPMRKDCVALIQRIYSKHCAS